MNLERLPFDQYQRYRLVADTLRNLAATRDSSARRLRVLDVGGRTGLLAAFTPECDVVSVDLEAPSGRLDCPFVLGDGAALPFGTETFDAVCALDTLEHVPVEARDAFLGELWRVAHDWVLVVGPYSAPQVKRAEKLLAGFFKHKLRAPHCYLDEHQQLGLPRRTETARAFKQWGGQVTTAGHGQLERWSALMALSMYFDHDPALRPLAAQLYAFYNRILYATDTQGPFYRHLIVSAFNGATLPDWDAVLPAPQDAPSVERALLELSQELLAFDRERGAWQAERAAFETSVATLSADLEGHRASLLNLTVERNAALKSMHIMQRDLDGHSNALRELRQHLEEQESSRALVQGERDAALESVRILEADLAGHRQALDVMGRDLEGHRGALSDLRSQVDHERALRAELTETQAKLHAERQKLRASRKEVRDLRADLLIEQAQNAESEAAAIAFDSLSEAELKKLREELDALSAGMSKPKSTRPKHSKAKTSSQPKRSNRPKKRDQKQSDHDQEER